MNAWPEAVADFARPANLSRWYNARAHESEVDGIGCRWELDRLIELEGPLTPRNWLNRARRAHLDAREKHQANFAAAAAEYKCIEAIAREPLQAWYQQCASEARYAGDWSLAQWYLDRLITARPGDWHLYEQRAAVRFAQGPDRKKDARASKQIALDNSRSKFSLATCERHALLSLWLREKNEYLAVRARALKQYQAKWSQQPVTMDAAPLAWLCTLCPGAVTEPDGEGSLDRWTKNREEWLPKLEGRLSKRLQTDESARQFYADTSYRVLYARAAVLYRAGKYEEALSRLKKLVTLERVERVWHFPLLALVYTRLNNTTEARIWLKKTANWLKNHPPGKSAWFDRLTVQLLHEEVKNVLDGEDSEE
jgi:tetratricopeptide (TPR) repeat protein